MDAGHDHRVAGSNRFRLGIAIAITACVLAAEVVGAWLTGSLALLVDAGHMLTDVGGLSMALLAVGINAFVEGVLRLIAPPRGQQTASSVTARGRGNSARS